MKTLQPQQAGHGDALLAKSKQPCRKQGAGAPPQKTFKSVDLGLNRCQQLQERVKLLEEKLRISESEQHLARLRHVTALETARNAAHGRTTVHQELEDTRRKMTALGADKSGLLARIDNLQKFLHQERTSRQALELRVAEEQRKNAVLNSQLEAAGRQVISLRQLLEDAGKEHDGRDEAAKKSQRMCEAVQEELEASKIRVMAADHEVAALNLERDQLSNQVSGLKLLLEQLYATRQPLPPLVGSAAVVASRRDPSHGHEANASPPDPSDKTPHEDVISNPLMFRISKHRQRRGLGFRRGRDDVKAVWKPPLDEPHPISPAALPSGLLALKASRKAFFQTTTKRKPTGSIDGRYFAAPALASPASADVDADEKDSCDDGTTTTTSDDGTMTTSSDDDDATTTSSPTVGALLGGIISRGHCHVDDQHERDDKLCLSTVRYIKAGLQSAYNDFRPHYNEAALKKSRYGHQPPMQQAGSSLSSSAAASTSLVNRTWETDDDVGNSGGGGSSGEGGGGNCPSSLTNCIHDAKEQTHHQPVSPDCTSCNSSCHSGLCHEAVNISYRHDQKVIRSGKAISTVLAVPTVSEEPTEQQCSVSAIGGLTSSSSTSTSSSNNSITSTETHRNGSSSCVLSSNCDDSDAQSSEAVSSESRVQPIMSLMQARRRNVAFMATPDPNKTCGISHHACCSPASNSITNSRYQICDDYTDACSSRLKHNYDRPAISRTILSSILLQDPADDHYFRHHSSNSHNTAASGSASVPQHQGGASEASAAAGISSAADDDDARIVLRSPCFRARRPRSVASPCSRSSGGSFGRSLLKQSCDAPVATSASDKARTNSGARSTPSTPSLPVISKIGIKI
ncbi:hypothetical protein CEUSTIGMA_g8484.t1 [Chlamydomonas eustigma]|uniref:Uncharacterized protein n=1 Tax=Chlamydomonas eustigma TaxID=1157962 RepID=A0A250XDQ7_9CHLO|nr:hypothetical protein CEUSTIGMA_g8484.t1 [Chlamydomonas eustigma]|eukprot:GAX81049.1 hypothetical protein CEUSTIGMA_g8484.t1 [Chlamydomonas eustigma]